MLLAPLDYEKQLFNMVNLMNVGICRSDYIECGPIL